MGIGLSNYDFGAKGNWRRWAWNRAKERLAVPVKDAVVLYLPSRQNLDLKIATQKGFRPGNMFGVERDKDIIKKLRKDGVNVIDGDFNYVLHNWNKTLKIDVIIADFCCGFDAFTENRSDFISTLLKCEGLKYGENNFTSVVVNLMRGRDKFGGYLSKIKPDIGKHRGKMFVGCYAEVWLDALSHRHPNYPPDAIFNFILNKMNPIFKTYKSLNSSIYMDSACINVFGINPKNKLLQDQKIMQKIAAAKAIRTMRLAS